MLRRASISAAGSLIQPEVVALIIGLSLSSLGLSSRRSSVRGIMAVSHGQTEASLALGLKPRWTLRLAVILPQAHRHPADGEPVSSTW